MPIYEFKCNSCGKEFEALVMSQDEEVRCPECGSEKVERLLSVFSSSGSQASSSCGTGGFS